MATTTKPKPTEDETITKEDVGTLSAQDLAPSAPKEPFKFEFKISRGIPIPEKVRKAGPNVNAHPFPAEWDRMGHNDSLFVPTDYWTKARGHDVAKAKLSWQKGTLGNLFTNWKGKDKEARGKWRLVSVTREVGDDAEFPAMSGVRTWLVDTSRA